MDRMSSIHAPWYQQNLLLIGLAAVLCVAGALATSRFFRRMTVVQARQRHAWLFLTALASGVTIWCTHFIAMLGYHPGVAISFDWAVTSLSLAIPIVGSAVGFFIAGRPRASRLRCAIGGLVLGLSISAMHYLGMNALQMQGMMSWDWPLISVSVLLAVVGSIAALVAARSTRPHADNLMAALFVAAVVLLHFTGMSAMTVMRNAGVAMTSSSGADTELALAIAALSLVTIGAGVMGYLIDSQSRSAAMERYRDLAMSDGLTGLPNRAHLNERLAHEIAQAQELSTRLGLTIIDVDGFKEINDLRGHLVGDEVLRVLARRMGKLTLETDTVFAARMGGDEFIVLCRVEDDHTLPNLLEELRQSVSRLIHLGSEEPLVPRLSMGAAVFPDNAADAEALLSNADLAMYRAKSDSIVDTCFYDPEIDEQTRLRRGLIADLREACDRGEVFLHYQAQASVASGETLGYEALLRWSHPVLGLISPAEFIPLAEESRLIVPIGEWVLRTACAEAARWQPPFRLSVNLSAVQLAEAGFAETIRDVLAETGIAPERLELEVTETAVFSDRKQALRTLQEIKELGVSIALDDFGVGYSSLDALRMFPFDRIKLDRSFFIGDTRERTIALVDTVLSLGRIFGMSVLAEGIETQDQLALLSDTGCDEVQGYLFGRPKSLEEIIDAGELSRTGSAADQAELDSGVDELDSDDDELVVRAVDSVEAGPATADL
jgi:diguanylate cyclase (GGDEF)-like protein